MSKTNTRMLLRCAVFAALTAVGGILFGGLLDYLALRKTRLI